MLLEACFKTALIWTARNADVTSRVLPLPIPLPLLSMVWCNVQNQIRPPKIRSQKLWNVRGSFSSLAACVAMIGKVAAVTYVCLFTNENKTMKIFFPIEFCALDSEWVTLLNFVEQSIKICSDVLLCSSRNTAVSVPNHTHGTCIVNVVAHSFYYYYTRKI